jgi:hypothetical protein
MDNLSNAMVLFSWAVWADENDAVGLLQTFLPALGMHRSQRVPITTPSDHHHSETDRKGPHLNQKLDVLAGGDS